MDMRQVNRLPKCSPPKGLATTAISWSKAPAWLETGHVCCKATKPVGAVMCFWCLGKWHFSCAAKCPEVWDEAQKSFYKSCSDLEWMQEMWQCPRCYFTLGKWQWFQKMADDKEEKAKREAKLDMEREKRRWECPEPDCGFSGVGGSSGLKRHMDCHKGITYPCLFPGCKTVLTTNDSRKRHMKTFNCLGNAKKKQTLVAATPLLTQPALAQPVTAPTNRQLQYVPAEAAPSSEE
jgi:hypothetical protein